MSGEIIRRDFTVVPTAKRFNVRGRVSEWDGQEWHWLEGWHLGSFRTLERAQQEADRLNRSYATDVERKS